MIQFDDWRKQSKEERRPEGRRAEQKREAQTPPRSKQMEHSVAQFSTPQKLQYSRHLLRYLEKQ
jgi:hypothetical protein